MTKRNLDLENEKAARELRELLSGETSKDPEPTIEDVLRSMGFDLNGFDQDK